VNPLAAPIIPRSLTQDVSVRGGSRRETLSADMTTQGLEDILHYGRFLFVTDVDRQIQLGNPPDQIIVDGRDNKPLDMMQRRAVAVFGSLNTPPLMIALMNTLAASIAKTTTPRTGKLADLNNWQWFLNGKPIAGPAAVRQFGQRDVLTYAPTRVVKPGGGYATVANQKVVSTNKATVSRRISKKKRVEGGPTHRKFSSGFMGLTAQKMRTMTPFRTHAISVQWDRAGAFGPNLGNQGMAFFMIRLRKTKRFSGGAR
jgi:hypothetical protein